MISKIKSKSGFLFFLSTLVAWTILLWGSMYASFSADNLIYAIGQKHAFDNSLFQQNIFMGDNVISPRYIADAVFSFIVKMNGGSWGGAAIVWLYFGVFVQSIAIANISKRISEKYQVINSLIFTCLILYCNNFLAGFSLVALSSTSIGVALAFSFLSISFLVGEKRDYNLAWIFAGVSIIFHIHEGLYCCVVIFIFALSDCIMQKKVLLKENAAVLVAVIVMAGIVLPNMLTDSMDITNSEFVYIYSTFRHPHHLVPSSWDMDTVYQTILVNISFMFLGIESAYLRKKDNLKQKAIEMGLLICAWVGAVSVMYLFTEIKPLAIISTMFVSKSFKYVLLVALIWLMRAFVDFREKGLNISSYLVVYIGMFATSFATKDLLLIMLIVVAVIWVENYFVDKENVMIAQKSLKIVDVLVFVTFLFVKRDTFGIRIGTILDLCMVLKKVIPSMTVGTCIILVGFAVFAIAFALDKKFKGYRLLSGLACICMLCLSLFGRIIVPVDGNIQLISGELMLRQSIGSDALYELAVDFSKNTDKNDEFLADPDAESQTGWFQIVSERNCYVVSKVIPSSKATVDDWYERYMKVKGFGDKTGNDLRKIMKDGRISYVLINSSMYETVDNVDGFEVFLSASDDSYRIYKLD